jgi:hypothetical protein
MRMSRVAAKRSIFLGFLGTAAAACQTVPADAVETNVAALRSENGLTEINGLSGNGLSGNGLSGNGLSGNGLSGNGLSGNGLSLNGLSGNGLSSTSGLMTTDSGRTTVAYIVKCALASGDSLVKEDQYGVSYTFTGSIGLAPQWKDGSCDVASGCIESISACLMAHVNTAGVHIPIWLDAPMPAVGWGRAPNFPNQEGTFYGDIFQHDATGLAEAYGTGSGLDAFFCNGPGMASNVVPGRLGATQVGSPYINPSGLYRLCGGLSAGVGPLAAYTWSTTGDGLASATFGTPYYRHFNFPVTVWRTNIWEAEAAALSGGAVVTSCTACSGGKSVTSITPSARVTFTVQNNDVTSSRVVDVYYTAATSRAFTISVNGSAAQTVTIAATGGSGQLGLQKPSLPLNHGSNTLTFSGGSNATGPDLDWVAVE